MRDLNDVWSKPIPEPTSPCKNVCVVSSQTGYCVGCFRTLSEIKDWIHATSIEKELILDKCEQRQKNAVSTIE